MKVLASTLAGLALGQRDQGEDRWTGFDYDYGFGTAERNQISQSNTINTLYAQGAGMQTDGSALIAAGDLGPLFNPYLSTPTNHAANQVGNIAYPTYLGNGMMCWYCDAESVYDCFNAGQFQVCYGQDYFCYFHERRKIGHYFNRREKYIDHHESTNTDLFLVRLNNEAWNLDGNHLENDTRGTVSAPDSTMPGDDIRPKTDIHVMAGCQQPQACLRQQMQNQAINIGVAFYGDEAREIGNLHTGTTSGDFQTYIHPTSRRNVREGLCRLGKDWTYYSGKLWHYDTGGKFHNNDPTSLAGGSRCHAGGSPGGAIGSNCYYQINTIDKVNSVPISDIAESGTTSTGSSPMDSAEALAGAEADAVFGRQSTNIASPLLWGRGIYDAHDIHGHSFWHERESWYNGMRPNGFPDQHYHGGKGTESVCHFCCNPASSDGMFCNRRLLDNTRDAGGVGTPIATNGTNSHMGVTFTNGVGQWFKSDSHQTDEAGTAADGNYNLWNDVTTLSDDRNSYIDTDLVRADDPNLNILHTPMANSYNTEAAWLAEHRFHGMFRNPETQVSQEFLDPYFA